MPDWLTAVIVVVLSIAGAYVGWRVVRDDPIDPRGRGL